tara:strand:- start:57 stop:6794 length:6738 start_codon:yes stop_codon:yes gene_type:complete
MDPLKDIVQRMVDAGEPEENIAMVIEEYNSGYSAKQSPTETDTAVEEVESVSDSPSKSSDTKSILEKERKDELVFFKEDEEAVGIYENVVDFVTDIGRAIEQGNEQGKMTDKGLAIGFGEADDKTVVDWMEGKRKEARLSIESAEMRDFERIYQEEGESMYGFLKGVAANPSTLTTMLASSIASQVSSVMNSDSVANAATAGLAAGAAAGGAITALGGGIGAIPGAIAGTMTASMAMMEAGLTINELLMEEIGGDINDPGAKAKIRAVLDDPEKMKELRRKSAMRGTVIGAVELATMGLARGVGSKLASKGLAKTGLLAGAATEIIGGGLGEVGGRLAADQEMDIKEIGFEAFAGLGSAPITLGKQALQLQTSIQRAEIGKKLRASKEETGYDNIVDAYKSKTSKDGKNLGFKTTTTDIEIAKLSKSSKILDQQVKEKIDGGDITQEQGDKIRENFRNVQGSVNNMKSLDLTTEQEAAAVDKLTKYKKLTQELDQLKEGKAPSLQKKTKAQIDKLDSELGVIIEADSKAKVEESSSFAKTASKAFGLEFIDDQKAIDEKIKADPKYKDADGWFEDGTIYVNKKVAAQTRAVTVGSHELLHGILKNSLMTNKESGKIIQDFRSKLNDQQNEAIDSRANALGEDGKRLYSQKELDNSPDEYLAFFSDAIGKNEIKFEENVFTKIGDIITPILRKAGFAKIKFDTGKDVYNFMREYDKSVRSGKISTSITEDLGTDGQTTITETVEEKVKPVSKTSKTAKPKSNPLLNVEVSGVEPAQVETMVGKVANRAVAKYFQGIPRNIREKAGVDKNTYAQSAKTELVQIAQKYDPTKTDKDGNQVSFDRYMANTGMQRLNSLATRLGVETSEQGVTQSIDSKEAQQVVDTSTDISESTIVDTKPTTNPLKLFGTDTKAKDLFIKNTIDKFKNLLVDGLTFKSLKTLDEQGISDLVGIPANKIFNPKANLSTAEARKALMFINKYASTLLNLLPNNNTEIRNVDSKSNPNRKVLIGGEPTGLPKNIQKLFYNKGKRIGNNTQFTKKPGITVDSFKADLGIEGNIKSPDFKVRTNTSQAVKGILELTGRAMTNTASRQYLESIGYDPQVIDQIADGKNPKQFSKTQKQSLGAINVFQEAAVREGDFTSTDSQWKSIYKALGIQPMDPANIIDKERMEMFFAKVLPQYLPLEIIALLGPSMTNGPASYYKANSEKFKAASEKNPEEYPTTDINGSKKSKAALAITAKSKQKFVQESLYEGNSKNIDSGKSFWFENTNSAKEISEKYNGNVEIGSKYKLSEKQISDVKVMFEKQGLTSGTGKDRKVQQKFLKEKWGTKALEQQNAAKLRGLETMFKVFEQMMKDDSSNAQMIIGVLSKTSGHQNGFVRVAAPMGFVGNNLDGVEIVEEHTLPASNTAKYLFQQAVEGTVSKNFKGIEKNYMQGVLSKLDDNKLKGIGIDGQPFNYISTMPNGWALTDNVWARYFNSNVANGLTFGIDPNNIILATGKSVAETFGVDNTGADIALIKSIKQLRAEYNKKQGPAVIPKEVQNEQSFSKTPKFSNSEILNNFRLIDNFSKQQEAIFTNGLNLNKDFNDILQNKSGIASEKTYSKIKGEVVGANKGRFNWFIPPSAEDFVGLLYKTLGKGKIGNDQMAWYKAHLLNPYARAMDALSRSRVALMNDFKALKKQLKVIPKNLKKKIPGEGFTKEQAIRAYIWGKQNMNIPGLSQTDLKELISYIESQKDLKSFADELIYLQKGDQYAAPREGWLAGTITTDLIEGINTIKRAKFLEQWQQNVDSIFSEENLNKMEAIYGKNYRIALDNILNRMKTGKNRSFGGDTLTGRVTDWLTNSIGAIMFFNTRSAVLQTISAINFINFGDNNIFAAGKAFANQPQYWKDFKKLFNSDFLVERRDGLKLNVNEADIAEMAKKGGVKGVISELLRLGFLPTQIADSFAIASGGSTFYRNRIKALENQGMSKTEAETQAFQDFRETAEESQQSSRPDRISQQQAGPLGRIILAFANTPAQYARIIKKAASDIKNGRGDMKANVSKIIYYGVAQNLIFNAMQQALFALAFDDEDDKDDENKRYTNVANGMADSLLRGAGLGGAIFSVLKNLALRLNQESDKKSPKYQDVLVKEILQISPPISSKVGKLKAAGRSYSWNKKEMMEKGWSIDNPAYLAAGQVIAATTNIPLDRAFKKINNLRNASNSDLEAWQRVASAAGWSEWELGIQDSKKDNKRTTRKRSLTRKTRKRKIRE